MWYEGGSLSEVSKKLNHRNAGTVYSALVTEAASIAAPYAASVFGARLAGAPSNAWRICIHCGLLAPPPLVSTRRRGEAPSEASAAYLKEGRAGGGT